MAHLSERSATTTAVRFRIPAPEKLYFRSWDLSSVSPVPQTHLYVMPFDSRKPVPFLKTAQRTKEGQISPNGRWLSYSSYESGRSEIYVQGFNLDPAQARGKWQVSVRAGFEARWRHDGKELFYRAGKNIMAVAVKTDGSSFEAGIPKPLFPVAMNTAVGRNHFVVTNDGERFLVITPVEEGSNEPIEVMVNWR